VPDEPQRTEIQGWSVVNETVEELLRAVRHFLKDEADRSASLMARGSGLTGFVGIILSVAAAVGAFGTSGLGGLHHSVRVLAGALVTLALVLLVASVVAVVLKVLRPAPGFTVATEEVEQYPTFGFISRDRVMVQGDLMTGLVAALRKDRDNNDDKAKWLQRSYYGVCVALGLVALAGALGTLDRYVAGADSREPAQHSGARNGG
jgi:hypothetical protein